MHPRKQLIMPFPMQMNEYNLKHQFHHLIIQYKIAEMLLRYMLLMRLTTEVDKI